MGISGDVETKRRTLKILVFGIHPAEFAKDGAGGGKSSIDKQILNLFVSIAFVLDRSYPDFLSIIIHGIKNPVLANS